MNGLTEVVGYAIKTNPVMITKLKNGIDDKMITKANTQCICSHNILRLNETDGEKYERNLIDFDLGLNGWSVAFLVEDWRTGRKSHMHYDLQLLT